MFLNLAIKLCCHYVAWLLVASAITGAANIGLANKRCYLGVKLSEQNYKIFGKINL